MSINGTLKYGLRPTVQLSGNISPFAATYTLKQDDPDGHARAIADLVGSADFGEAVSEMALIHIFSLSRIDRDHILFQTNFDGDVVAYFEGFKPLEAPLREILAHFEGAPGPDAEFTALLEFIAAGQVEVIGYFSGYPELTVNQIRRDADWRSKLIDMQKSLAQPAGKVAWGQSASGLA